MFLQQVIFLLGSFSGYNQQVFPRGKRLQCGCLVPAYSPPSPNLLCHGTSLSLAGNSQQREAPAQGHDQVTAILCVMLMDVSTLLPSWGPGHSSAPSGCTGEPRAQNAHAKGWSSCQAFVSGVPGSFASGKLFPVVRAALSSAPKPWHLGRVIPFVSFSFFPDLT